MHKFLSFFPLEIIVLPLSNCPHFHFISGQLSLESVHAAKEWLVCPVLVSYVLHERFVVTE